MTDASELGALYVRDEEILKRMGLAGGAAYKTLRSLRKDPRCPGRTIGGKTYWPAFRRFLDLINGLPVTSEVDEGPIPTRVLKQRPCPRLETTELWSPEAEPPLPASDLDAERIRTRRGYTDTDGNFRISITGAGKVRVVAPDGRRWIEEAKPSDPAAWQRKRKFVPRKTSSGVQT